MVGVKYAIHEIQKSNLVYIFRRDPSSIRCNRISNLFPHIRGVHLTWFVQATLFNIVHMETVNGNRKTYSVPIRRRRSKLVVALLLACALTAGLFACSRTPTKPIDVRRVWWTLLWGGWRTCVLVLCGPYGNQLLWGVFGTPLANVARSANSSPISHKFCIEACKFPEYI